MIVLFKPMKQTGIKYLSVTFLLLLFLLKGLVTILPIFTDFCWTPDRQEMKMNSQSENTEDPTHEKQLEIKEFLGHFYNGHSSSLKYAHISKSTPVTYVQFETKVFLPVNTPPPKSIL